MKNIVKEKETQKAIMEVLEWKHIFHWRNNSGAIVSEYKGKQRFMRFGDTGSPDIFAVKDGKIIGIEVKSSIGKQSDNQKDWQERFEKAGGTYILAKSINDIITL